MDEIRSRIWIFPGIVTAILLTAVVVLVVYTNQGDPLSLARIGTKYSIGDPGGSEGYDGQFAYFMAINPNLKVVKRHLDVPAYRYQRILQPLIVRTLSFGEAKLIPWMFPIVNIITHTFGTIGVAWLLKSWGVNSWFALSYGLFAGFTLAVRLDLPEPMAYALIVLATVFIEKKRQLLAILVFLLALFTKEVTILYLLAFMVYLFFERNWGKLSITILIVLIPYIIFQLWLNQEFGNFGIASGGFEATSFEVIPFMGLFRIGNYSYIYLIAMIIAFLPSTIFPSVWGFFNSIKSINTTTNKFILFSTMLNCLAIFFLPFSTFRETGGLLRFSCGLILATLLFAVQLKQVRFVRYSPIWMVYNIFLFK